MRLLLDQGTPRTAAALLRAAWFDAVHTAEAGLATAEDREILQRAVENNSVVVTLDADFHALLARSQAVVPSVIRIRIEGLRAEEFSQLVQQVISQSSADLEEGAMVSVREYEIRIRRLPVA